MQGFPPSPPSSWHPFCTASKALTGPHAGVVVGGIENVLHGCSASRFT